MDGIEKNPDVAASDYVTPYGPSGNEFYRYKLLMDGLIPNSGSTFSNTSLRPAEKVYILYVLNNPHHKVIEKLNNSQATKILL